MSPITIVAIVTAVLFAGAGLAKLVSATMSIEQRDALGVQPGLWRTIGALEVAGALAVGATLLGWVPAWLGFAAAVGFVLLIVGAIMTRARAKSPFGMVLADVVTLIMAILTLGAMRALAMG
ncbi:MAG: DoxX family protein [Aeromicrobium sp.]